VKSAAFDGVSFADSVAAIMRLPPSDAEKAEALVASYLLNQCGAILRRLRLSTPRLRRFHRKLCNSMRSYANVSR
jgi:hypothetical protein